MDSGLHAVEGALIDKPMDCALRSGRAFQFQPASRASRSAVADRPITSMDSGRAQGLPGGATDRVAVLVVEELDWSKMFGVHRAALDWRSTLDVLAFAAGDFLRVRIAAVGEHLELTYLQHGFGRDRHRMKKMAVVCVIVDVMVDDQPTRNVNNALQIV